MFDNTLNTYLSTLNGDIRQKKWRVFIVADKFDNDNNFGADKFSHNCQKSPREHVALRGRSFAVSDLRLETKGSQFESGCYV